MKKTNIKKYLIFMLGVLLNATAFNLFFLSNNLAAYGVSGLSIVLNKLLGIDPTIFILAANTVLIIISYFALGKDYTRKTILGGILFPIFINLTAKPLSFIDLSNTNLLAMAIIGGALAGVACALTYKDGFGAAGTDITNRIIHKYFKIPLGTATAIGEGLVILSGGLVFGFEKMILSLIVLTTMTIICNKMMIGISTTKTCFIVTSKEKEIKEHLIKNLKNDITIINSVGGYNENTQQILMTVIDSKKYSNLKNDIKKIDRNAFIAVTDSFEVLNQNQKIKKIK